MFGGVTVVDTDRTNSLQTVWLTIPSLKTMSWSVVWKCLDRQRMYESQRTLADLGVPLDLLPPG